MIFYKRIIFSLIVALVGFVVVNEVWDSRNGIVSPISNFLFISPISIENDRPTSNTKNTPVTLKIDKLNLRLPIQAATVHGNTWDLYDQSVAWLSTSAIAGEGNTVLYAHDWINLFGYLYKLKKGDELKVMQNGKWLAYQVTDNHLINPGDVSAVLSSKNQLTLYTCEGTFDSKRRIVYADLINK
jgi:LPXTG-site transpeptidase (sortase) family protein